MGKLKALGEKVNINGKRILVRVDLNVPIKDKKVTDDSRIKKIIPILKELILRNSKIILISHLGRPKGKYDLAQGSQHRAVRCQFNTFTVTGRTSN